LSADEYAQFRADLTAELDRHDLFAPHQDDGLVKVWYVGNRATRSKANLKEPVGELWLGDLARAYHRCEPDERPDLVSTHLELIMQSWSTTRRS
jgi:hypothetical protein